MTSTLLKYLNEVLGRFEAEQVVGTVTVQEVWDVLSKETVTLQQDMQYTLRNNYE